MGPEYQIIDLLPTIGSQNEKVELASEVWNPDRISADNLGR